MNKSNKETNLIKKLLADQLDKKERKKLYYSNLIEKQMRKQWKENRNIPVENEIGNKIWDKIENQCIKVHKRIVPLELWYIAASVALVLIVGGLWMHLNEGSTRWINILKLQLRKAECIYYQIVRRSGCSREVLYVLPKISRSIGMYG